MGCCSCFLRYISKINATIWQKQKENIQITIIIIIINYVRSPSHKVSGRLKPGMKFAVENPLPMFINRSPSMHGKQPTKQTYTSKKHINFTCCGQKDEFDKPLPGRLMAEEQSRQGLSLPSSLLDRSCQFSFLAYCLPTSNFCKF